MICAPASWLKLLLVILTPSALVAGEGELKTTLLGIYNQTIDAMQQARTKHDVETLVNRIDARHWCGLTFEGRCTSREEAERVLESTLGRAQRNRPNISILWLAESQGKAIVVAWVYENSEKIDAAGEFGEKGAKHEIVTGTLVRDTWISTKAGWRRRVHEKIFPNRALAVDGKAIILP